MRFGPALFVALPLSRNLTACPKASVSMLFLDAVAQKQILGRPVGDIVFLLGGAVAGILGGVLAAPAGRGEIRGPEPGG